MKFTALYDLPMGEYFLQLDDKDYFSLRNQLHLLTGKKVFFTPTHDILIIEDIDNHISISKYTPHNNVKTVILSLIHNLIYRNPCMEMLITDSHVQLSDSDKELIYCIFKDTIINGYIYDILNDLYTPRAVKFNTFEFKSFRCRPYVSINDNKIMLYHSKLFSHCPYLFPCVIREDFTFYCYTNKIGKAVYSTKLNSQFIRNWIKAGFTTLTRITASNSYYNLGNALQFTKIIKGIGGNPIVTLDIEEEELFTIINNLPEDCAYYKRLTEIYNQQFSMSFTECQETLSEYIRSINAILYNNMHYILHRLCVELQLIHEAEYIQEYDTVELQTILCDYVRLHGVYGKDYPIYEYFPSLGIQYVIKNLSSNISSTTLRNVYKCTERGTILLNLPIYGRGIIDKKLGNIVKEILYNSNIHIDFRLTNSINIFRE